MGNLQMGGADPIDWTEEFQQQRFARSGSNQFNNQQIGQSNAYRPNIARQVQGTQYPPAVPLERQLPSSGPAVQDYEQAQRQFPRQGQYGAGPFAQQQYGRPINNPQSFNYSTGQEPQQNLPTRTLPPPAQQYSNATSGPQPGLQYPPTSNQPGNFQGMPGSQTGYDPQYPYNQYQGQHGYR